MIRDRFINTNNRRIIVEAALTRFSRFKNRITQIIKEDVKIIENVGVPLLDIFLNILGNNSSLPIAKGVLDAASNPALAVVAEIVKVRVLAETIDKEGSWGTIGAHENIIVASWDALVDSYVFKLLKDKSNW